MKSTLSLFVALGLAVVGVSCGTSNCCSEETGSNPYIGRWALTIPGGGAGWLGVSEKEDGTLQSSILWGGGSIVPTSETKLDNDTLVVIRKHNHRRDNQDHWWTETITAKRDGDTLKLNTRTVDDTGAERGKSDFSGKKIPPLPKAPDLAKIKYGAPIPLLKGNSLENAGWKSMGGTVCWSIENGTLSNRVNGKHGANIRTIAEFEDFNLKTEVRMLPGGNSGIYLRGIYEIQMADTYGQTRDSHHMGGLYSRITPAIAAEKPAGEWQTVDITLVNRHLTVILNGVKTIDNQPVLGCTGGAMTSDEFKPGPIYLQGDHSDVDYRNMVLTPILEKK